MDSYMCTRANGCAESDWTLNDLNRFCTKQHCTVFCINPTFSLGNLSVTVTTYCHLVLHNSDGKHLVMMGTILIHKLVGMKPSQRNLRVVPMERRLSTMLCM